VGEKEKDGKDNGKTLNYDKDKYREMILDAAETVLGYFGFDRTVYELQEGRTKDIQSEMMIEKQ
jgi:hypothetical protein